jgi:hypothetical protein
MVALNNVLAGLDLDSRCGVLSGSSVPVYSICSLPPQHANDALYGQISQLQLNWVAISLISTRNSSLVNWYIELGTLELPPSVLCFMENELFDP